MLGALAVYLQPPASRSWQEFALGPASGGETRISPTAIHSDGTIPQTRIIGPWWLAAYRYSITAATAPNGSDSLHGLLQQELTTRLGLATHVEDRDFGIWVLMAKTPPVNLEQTNARGASIQVHDRGLRAQDASIADTSRRPPEHSRQAGC